MLLFDSLRCLYKGSLFYFLPAGLNAHRKNIAVKMFFHSVTPKAYPTQALLITLKNLLGTSCKLSKNYCVWNGKNTSHLRRNGDWCRSWISSVQTLRSSTCGITQCPDFFFFGALKTKACWQVLQPWTLCCTKLISLEYLARLSGRLKWSTWLQKGVKYTGVQIDTGG